MALAIYHSNVFRSLCIAKFGTNYLKIRTSSDQTKGGESIGGCSNPTEMGVKRMFLIENDASYTRSAWTLLKVYVLKPPLAETASYYADMPLNI